MSGSDAGVSFDIERVPAVSITVVVRSPVHGSFAMPGRQSQTVGSGPSEGVGLSFGPEVDAAEVGAAEVEFEAAGAGVGEEVAPLQAAASTTIAIRR